MNQEELDLYIELQPRLLEYRGGWQDGDEYFYVMFGTVYSYSDYSLKSNDEPAIWIPKASGLGGRQKMSGRETAKRSRFQCIAIWVFSHIWYRRLTDTYTGRQNTVVRVRGWRTALVDSPHGERSIRTWRFCR